MASRRFIIGFSYLVLGLFFVAYQVKADSIENLQATLNAISYQGVTLSGAQRNVLLRLSLSWTEVDSVGFCSDSLYPNATGSSCDYGITCDPCYDHILFTPVDDTTSCFTYVIAYPHRMMERLIPHEIGWNRCLGDWTVTGEPDDIQSDPPTVYERNVVLSGNVLVSIPCGTWTIHYVIDGMRWDFYWAYPPSYHCRQGMQALMGGDGAEYNSLWSLAWTYPILDYVEDHSWIHLTDEVTASLCGPSPIDAHVQIHFNGYVKPDGSDGKDWLPSPGDSIGLKFGFQSDVTGPINVRYTISDISMWAGRCMNEPWAAPAPRHTGLKGEAPNPITGTQFDFDAWIGDPAQYDLKVYDLKSSLDPLYAEYMGIPDSVSFDSLSKSISTLVAEKEVRGPSSDDILWIVARDYGMDCSVTPTASAFQGKLAFMQALVTEFGDSVYNVTVPRDNDGIDTLSVGFATGDFMADAWEEKCFPDSLGYDIREIQPFIDTAATAASYPVMDKDSIPRGRKVLNCYWDGDYLTNWEEYRGFIVLSDSLDITSDSTHRRTNPREKTVFVHFRPDIQSDVADNIPKFIFQMPGVDVYNTNYLQTNLERNSSERKISENRTGASTLYPPLLYPRSVPINDSYRPNAVTFWRALTSDNDPINDLDTLYSIQNGIARFSFGGTISHGFAFHGEKVVIPSVTSRIIVRTGSIYQYGRLSSYYDTDSELWRNTYSRLIQRNISHEFGHSVGMNHVDRSTGGFMYIPEPMQNEAYPWPEEIYPTGSMIQFLVRRPLP